MTSAAVTAPRITVGGATTALCRRTVLRKAFLGSWHPLVDQIWLYSLASAQSETGVAIHHSARLPNHHHTTVTPSGTNLPDFTQRLHRDVSCALNRLLERERYDPPHELFDDRQGHAMRLVDAAAQASHLVYEYLNPVAAGLVQRPEHMPGRTLDFGLWKTGFIEVERPPIYFDPRRPQRLRLELTPPPLLYYEFGGDLDRLVHHMNRLAEGGIRAFRAVRKRPVMGAKALRRLHPWSEPRTKREPENHHVPTFRIGATGIVGRQERRTAAEEVKGFRTEHKEARVAHRDGDRRREFPFGTYAMVVRHGAPMKSNPPSDSLVAQPGPLLEDVKATLATEEHRRRIRRRAAQDFLDAVRSALSSEAAEIVQHSDLVLTEGAGSSVSRQHRDAPDDVERATDDSSEDRVPLVIRHRFDDAPFDHPADGPARYTTLRDERPGRRARSGKRRRDPPPAR